MSLTVVVVDDTDALRAAVCRYLASPGVGFQVVGQARDGAEAVDVVARARPAVVVLDLAMPVMDGFAALPVLVRENPGVAVVVFSSELVPGVCDRVAALGAAACLGKADGLPALAAACRRAAPAPEAGPQLVAP